MKKEFRFKALDNAFFDTRIKSYNVRNCERWIGYFLAPSIVACMYATCSGSYLNTFYTDVLKISSIGGGLFLTLMPVLSKILDAVTNIIMGRLVDNTKSRQGKSRPWILMSGVLMAVSSILLFLAPKVNETIMVIWVTFSYNLYFCVSYTMYNLSNVLMVPLSTRNGKQRDNLAMAQSMGIINLATK